MKTTSITENITDIQTETEVTDAVDTIIANAAEETSKLKEMLSSIADKILASVPSLLFAIGIFFLGIVISKIVLRIFKKCLVRGNVDEAAMGFLLSLVKVILYTVDIIITLSLMNIPMTSIIAVISAAGLAVGLALQNSLANVAGGFIILFTKPFKSGDYIETNSATGTVETIGILYTKILTNSNKTVYIPNGKVTDSLITNYSEQPLRRVDFEFGISYTDDLEKAKAIILNEISNHKLLLNAPEPLVRLGMQAEDSLQIIVQVWTENANYWQAKYDLTELVNEAFIKNNITIPFRQLDVHIIKE